MARGLSLRNGAATRARAGARGPSFWFYQQRHTQRPVWSLRVLAYQCDQCPGAAA